MVGYDKFPKTWQSDTINTNYDADPISIIEPTEVNRPLTRLQAQKMKVDFQVAVLKTFEVETTETGKRMVNRLSRIPSSQEQLGDLGKP